MRGSGKRQHGLLDADEAGCVVVGGDMLDLLGPGMAWAEGVLDAGLEGCSSCKYWRCVILHAMWARGWLGGDVDVALPMMSPYHCAVVLHVAQVQGGDVQRAGGLQRQRPQPLQRECKRKGYGKSL